MYRFLASTRWLGWLTMVIIFAAVCGALSWWQWDRRAEVAQQNRVVAANWDASPASEGAEGSLFASLPPQREYTPVELHGTYLPDRQLLVRQRSSGGELGMEQLVPFRTDGGRTVVVDRGWLPIGQAQDQRPDAVPAPPTGHVTVVVRAIAGEPDIGKDAPDGQIASIDLPRMAAETGLPLQTGAYGALASENPSVAQTPAPLPQPQKDEGMHWSYALQWLGFAVLFFVAFGYAARQQAKITREERAAAARGEEPRFRARKLPAQRPQRARRDGEPTDEQVEDFYLDQRGL